MKARVGNFTDGHRVSSFAAVTPAADPQFGMAFAALLGSFFMRNLSSPLKSLQVLLLAFTGSKATFAGGGTSGYSNLDVATTVRYAGDDPLVGAHDPQGHHASTVSAVNLTELRTVVDAARAPAGLGGAVWKSDPTPQTGGQILTAHFLELRTNLNPALTALGISVIPDDQTLAVGKPVLTAHIQNVREKVR
jgi:hypothetical protein